MILCHKIFLMFCRIQFIFNLLSLKLIHRASFGEVCKFVKRRPEYLAKLKPSIAAQAGRGLLNWYSPKQNMSGAWWVAGCSRVINGVNTLNCEQTDLIFQFKGSKE